jgi:hypothetical protein
VIDIVEVLEHWYAGRSKAQVSASLGLDRKTVRKYLVPAEGAGFSPSGPPRADRDLGHPGPAVVPRASRTRGVTRQHHGTTLAPTTWDHLGRPRPV